MTTLTIFSAPCRTRASAVPVALSPARASFGSVAIDTPSHANTFTLENHQSKTLKITSITLSNSDFAETSTSCGGSLAAGSSCTITVTLTPSVLGAESATLTVNENALAPYNALTSALSGTGVADAGLTPGTHSFGSVALSTASNPEYFTLQNTELTPLSISSIGFTGANAGDFSQTNTCGSNLASYASCTISVTLTPSVLGAETATLTVNDSAALAQYQTLTSSLSGTGVAQATVTPASLTFSKQPVGTTSSAQTFILTNNLYATLSITSLEITGTNASDFAQINTCGSSVAPGASCKVGVTFTPTAGGSRTAAVSITDNASGSPQTVSLSGMGTASGIGLSPTNLSFGNQSVSTTSAAQTVTLTNSGNATLSITSLAIAGTNASDFAQINTCGSSVAAGANCTISVTFTPTASGSATASVSITDNASGSPQAVALSGTGTAPTTSVSPTSLAFGNQPMDITTTAQTVTLSNTGNAPLSISSLALTGPNASDFAQTNTCGSSLAAGANCIIAVMFTPSVDAAEAATLSITDNASGSPQTVNLSGTGSPDVILSWTASPSSGVEGYNVYRGTASEQESSTPLNSTPINGTTYADENVTAGGTYYYVVTAVGSDGVLSAPSNETEATVP